MESRRATFSVEQQPASGCVSLPTALAERERRFLCALLLLPPPSEAAGAAFLALALSLALLPCFSCGSSSAADGTNACSAASGDLPSARLALGALPTAALITNTSSLSLSSSETSETFGRPGVTGVFLLLACAASASARPSSSM